MTGPSCPGVTPLSLGGANSRVVVIGGGFSGTLLAVNLLRRGVAGVILIERRETAGPGLAYSTSFDRHLLNVPAMRMGAFADDPGHFERWLVCRGLGAGSDFVPRRLYGEYLAGLMRDAMAAAHGRLVHVAGYAVDIDIAPHPRVRLADGRIVEAGAIALCMGNLPPASPAGLCLPDPSAGRFVNDPWTMDWSFVPRDEDVLIIGTGLTMIDTVLSLDVVGHEGRITCLSRRGLLPRVHSGGPRSIRLSPPAETGAAVLAAFRKRSDAIGWRSAIDELRPHIQEIWRASSPSRQRQFLRHLRPWWDVHRHRMAPPVASRIEALRETGRLRIIAGHLSQLDVGPHGVRASITRRGQATPVDEEFGCVLNCTGPQANLRKSAEPLIRNLLRKGIVQPGHHAMGLKVNRLSQLIGLDGKANEKLVALGPLTRGEFWEITSVPDIRVQADAVAVRLRQAFSAPSMQGYAAL